MDDKGAGLLCAVYGSRTQRALGWVVLKAYERGENGVWGWIGDRCDDGRVAILRRRAHRVEAGKRVRGLPADAAYAGSVFTELAHLAALSSPPSPTEHEHRYPQPNGQGFHPDQCLDCLEWK